MSIFTPGGDAKIIAEIAKKRFGGFAAMFEHHAWPERGSDMMRKVQKRVAETYGSVKAFEERFSDYDRPSGFIDPPSPFDHLNAWEEFLREMESIRPKRQDIDEHIEMARKMIAEKKVAAGAGRGR